MNTLIAKGKDELWHLRQYGSKIALCGAAVDHDVSPGIVQEVFERLSNTMDDRCFDCTRVQDSGLPQIEFWKTHKRTGESLNNHNFTGIIPFILLPSNELSMQLWTIDRQFTK